MRFISNCHPCVGRDLVQNAKGLLIVSLQRVREEIPAYAGMTTLLGCGLLLNACSTKQMAFGPDQCTAPTAREAQLTKTVWK